MSKKKIKIVIGIITFVCFFVCSKSSVFAAKFKSVTACLAASGGREKIESVNWACEAKIYDDITMGYTTDENVCTLWIGPIGNSKISEITISGDTNEAKIKYYGMCTNRYDTTSKIYVENDNNAINDRYNLARGLWGDPTSIETTLNVAKFIEGVNPIDDGEYNKYTRIIEVGRCHSVGGSCSSQSQEVSVLIPSTTHFEGYSKVRDTSTDWQNTSKSVSEYLASCGREACKVDFEHGVKRTKGSRSINFTVAGISKTFSTNPTITYNKDKTVNVGDSLCESLTFPPNSSSSSTVTTKACVKVPYNFTLSAKITDTKEVVFAGEKSTTMAAVDTEKRSNTTTQAEYATKAPNAKYAVISYISTSGKTPNASDFCRGNAYCNYYEIPDQTFNKNNELNGNTDSLGELAVTVPDVAAGSKFCVVVAVYPSNSLSDDKMDTDWSGGNWGVSDAKCYTVAKKPSFQVWGGTVYSNGAIKLSRNNKASSVGKVYGSWSELGIIAKNTVTDFTSGAALSGGVSVGKDSDVDCKLGPLTIANRDCKYGNSGIGVSDSIRASLAEYAKNHREEGHIQYCDADCIIDTNQIYQNDNNFKIIYAERDVKINCEVTRIDAIIAAGGMVDTCANPGAENGEAKNAANRSNQLIINGSVIASRLVLGRTYGAATGENTAIPAEIINALPSLYYWSVTEKSDSEGDNNMINLSTTYQRQLAPRQ